MNLQTWSIATINVKEINNPEKFDDVIHWIESKDLDITILTETKLDPTKAFHKFNKKNKKYVACWTFDCDQPKGSGVGIITKKSTVGKHHFLNRSPNGRILQAHFKFKGKIDLIIIGIYGPANHADKTSKKEIIQHINSNIHNKEKTHYIVAGDLNEDPEQHPHTPIIDQLTTKGLHTTYTDDHKQTPTWTNSSGTHRRLDHIYLSAGLFFNGTSTCIESTERFFQTDHLAVVTDFNANHILIEQSLAKRKIRRKKNLTEEVLDNFNITQTHWELYKKTLEEEFKDPFTNDSRCSIDFAYDKIADQLGKAARKTLRWKESGTSQNKFTKTETLTHKLRKLVVKYNYQFLTQASPLVQMQTIDEIRSHTPGIQWTNHHPINSTDFHLHIKETWKQQKARLYAQRKKEEYSKIIEAIKCREGNFEDNKGKMLSSALNKKRGKIDTTNIIYEGEFIEDPDLVKTAVRQSATKWTRKRILDKTNLEWVEEYNPIPTLQDTIFDNITEPINSDSVRETLA